MDFLAARSGLDLFFAQDRSFHAVVQFIPDEGLAAVSCGKSRNQGLAVLIGALEKVRGDARVKRTRCACWLRCKPRDASLWSPLRHCERSEAIQRKRRAALDCFVAALLAMTGWRRGVY
jgi:hypothetical protein